MRFTAPFLASIALLTLHHSALAQTDVERATARDAASAGLAQFQAGQYQQAIDSFSRAEQLVHAPTHLLYLARAEAKLGKVVAAHENYLKITRETLASNAPKAFADAQAAAEQERAAIDARLAYVTVSVHGAGAGELSVLMDDAKLPAAMVGIPLPADPGQHVFKASAPGQVSEPVTVTLSEGGKQSVLLKLGPAGAGDQPSDSASSNQPLPQSNTIDTGVPKSHALRSAAYASFAVGAVGLGAGAFFLVKSKSTRHDADQLYSACNTGSSTALCSDPAQESAIDSKDSSADGQRHLGVAGLIVGGVGAAAGVAFLILDGRSHASASNEHAAVRVVPVLGFRSVGLSGTF
ncbi:MAG TPA: hypothetical protein VGM44_05370 [Polyangiaceae bacterium]|jgi:hypothetical protein